jgi:iron complex outermembrane receptor protein
MNSSGNQKTTFRQELSAYYSRIRNWIIWQPASNGAWYWEAANIDEVFSRGLEYDFNSTFTTRCWKFIFNGNYAFTLVSNEHAVSSVDRSRRKQLVYVPRHNGNIHGAVTYMDWSLMIDIGYTGRRYTQSNNQWSQFESVLNPFWLTNAAVQKQIHMTGLEASVKVKADNLFNVNYQQILWRPMPGRYLTFIFSARFGK